MNICIFEDLFIHRLAPLNHLRHTSKLICGADTLMEKIVNFFPKKTTLTLHSRKYISEYCREKFPNAMVNELTEGEYIFFNSRVVFRPEHLKSITKLFKKETNSAIIQNRDVVAFHLTEDKVLQFCEIVNDEGDNLVTHGDIEWLGLKKIQVDSYRFINSPSDLILYNEEELQYDLNSEMGKKKLHIGKKCKIDKSVVFDTTLGNIYINDNCVIEPFTYIKGPVYIGENSTIRAGSQIYGPVRIGGQCKVSGEITCSILHWFVNKQHYGFLGHSYICEWVNLGAGTTTSNLKNNYAKISLNIGGEMFDTSSIFLGSLIGDHTKTGITTMLNTGSLVGISTNLYGAGYHSNLIKSFTWDNSSTNKNIPYQLDKAISTAKISMKRRNIDMSDAYEKMMRHVHEKKDENQI